MILSIFYKHSRYGVITVRILSLLSILFLSVLYLYCNGPFPSQTKPDVPSDHTISRNGVLHKEGETNPMDECTECHGSDLRGDVVSEEGVLRACQSCYQCHGSIWEGRGGGGADIELFKNQK